MVRGSLLLAGMSGGGLGWRAYFHQSSVSGAPQLCPIPDMEVYCKDDPVCEAHFIFQPYVQPTAARHLSHSSGANITRTFSHLPLVHSLLILPIGSEPQSCSKCELALASMPCPGLDNLYQAANDWLNKEALSSQPVSFLSTPAPNFSFQIMDAGSFSQAGKFASAPMLSKTATPTGICAPLTEVVSTKLSAHRNLVDLFSTHSMLFFLHSCAEKFESSLSQEDASAIWASMHLLLSNAPVALHPLAMDAMGSACHLWPKVQKDVTDALAIIKQVLMMAPSISLAPVDPGKAWEALKAVPPSTLGGETAPILTPAFKALFSFVCSSKGKVCSSTESSTDCSFQKE